MSKEQSSSLKKAVELQREYWRPNDEEEEQLRAKLAEASWKEKLRLLHLTCSRLLLRGAGKQQLLHDDLNEEPQPIDDPLVRLIQSLLLELLVDGSPYLPRAAFVWKGMGEAAELEERDPDHQGMLYNASLTHLGSLEVLRTDENNEVSKIDFIPFEQIRDIVVSSQKDPFSGFSLAKIFFDDERAQDFVLLPLLYGLSWASGLENDVDGSMTRFICSLEIPSTNRSLSIGIGQQDFFIRRQTQDVFGLASVAHVSFPLAVDDPNFEKKCKARGIDPKEILEELDLN